MPFALTQRLGVPEKDVQKWNSILLCVLGVAVFFGASKLHSPTHELIIALDGNKKYF
jgi:hypothetical protein